MKKRVVITGGTGFLGSNIIDSLGPYYDFYNLGRHEIKSCNNISWDLREDLPGISIPDNTEIVIHCAGIVGYNYNIEKKLYMDVNVNATLSLLELCSKQNIKHFIYISTGGVYGYNNEVLNEDNACKPVDFYSLTKYFSEMICDTYKNRFPITTLRLFFPYGLNQHGRLFYNLIDKVLNNEIIYLNNGGLPAINPVNIIDICNIIKGIIENKSEGTFNICGNEIITIEELCYLLSEKLGTGRLNLQYTNKNVGSLIGSNKKICGETGYKLRIGLNDGLNRIIESVKY